MSVVKINALSIPPQAGDEIVKRFTARMESLAEVAGFEGFELLRPTAETESRWFVYTRWADQESYNAWRDGDGARNAHARPPADGDGPTGAADDAEPPARPPVSMGAELLEFEVEVSAGASGVASVTD